MSDRVLERHREAAEEIRLAFYRRRDEDDEAPYLRVEGILARERALTIEECAEIAGGAATKSRRRATKYEAEGQEAMALICDAESDICGEVAAAILALLAAEDGEGK